VQHLRHALFPLLEAQRPVVERARQAEAVRHQRLFARAIAFVHGPDLRDRDVALVEHHQVVAREVVEQRGRRLARLAVAQVPAVVLDAVAEAHLLQQLEVVHGALLQALALQQLALGLEARERLAQLLADGVDGLLALLLGRDVVAAREDGGGLQLAQHLAAQRVHLADALDLVAPVLDAQGHVLGVHREHLHHVAAHPEGAAVEVDVVARVLDVHQPAQQLVAAQLLAHVQLHQHAAVPLGRADAVDARHARHDDDVPPRQERARGRVPHPVDAVVHDGVLLDVRVGRRDVGLGLVVVVVADEELHRVVREELAQLAVQLRRQRLVGRHHQRRPVHLLDDVGHREGLAAAGDAEEHLVGFARLETCDQLGDGAGLIAARLHGGDEAEVGHDGGSVAGAGVRGCQERLRSTVEARLRE
jgi:hypothetical protein